MLKYGSPPYLECSSHGDPRFSAFRATIRSSGKTIEELYQSSKKFDSPGSPRGYVSGLSVKEAKGRTPINPDYCRSFYSMLWDTYIRENPHLLAVLRSAPGLSDKFGQRGHACQAEELWRIRNSSKRTVVIHSKDATGEEREVYIGRPSKWGNPFRVGSEGTRSEVIRRYQEYVADHPVLAEAARTELAGKTLVCWCKPKACHGDVLASLANSASEKPRLF